MVKAINMVISLCLHQIFMPLHHYVRYIEDLDILRNIALTFFAKLAKFTTMSFSFQNGNILNRLTVQFLSASWSNYSCI